jgi:hypothetical protein
MRISISIYLEKRYKKLKNDKASGEDGIINEYIKSTAHQFINTNVYMKSYLI